MPKPPPTTDQILNDIKISNAAIAITVRDQLTIQNEILANAANSVSLEREHLNIDKAQLEELKDQTKILKQQLHVAQKQFEIAHEIWEIERKQLHVLRDIRAILKDEVEVHVYTLIVTKEKPMAVIPNVGAAFKVTMQDNGNAITPPDGTVYSWVTNDPTDVIEEVSIDGSKSQVRITVNGNDPNRTTLDITTSAPDPDGNEIAGELSVEIVPGVSHTYTLVVQQIVDPSINPLGHGHHAGGQSKPEAPAKAAQLPAKPGNPALGLR